MGYISGSFSALMLTNPSILLPDSGFHPLRLCIEISHLLVVLGNQTLALGHINVKLFRYFIQPSAHPVVFRFAETTAIQTFGQCFPLFYQGYASLVYTVDLIESRKTFLARLRC